MNRRKIGDHLAEDADDIEASDSDSLLHRNNQTSRIPSTETNTWKKYLCNRWTLLLFWITLSLWIVISIINLVRDVFPETDLVLNSKCSAPMQNWDGKILNFPVWKNSYSNRPSYYNLHYENDYIGNDTNHQIHLRDHAGEKRPVIIFGTHHKTGTFLAKKLFSRICSKMNWCCLFHVTRDSIHAVSAALQKEPVNALGHNQWIWNPQSLDITEYRFVHFYRHPYKKIISGYRYHADGTEEWTKKPLTYHKLCDSPLLSSPAAEGSAVSPAAVWGLCESVHLCETCCRMEHEQSATNGKVVSVKRSTEEYQFLCDTLGQGKAAVDRAFQELQQTPERLKHFHRTATPSIQEMLQTMPAKEGILAEAALDYYENLRMARIINETRADPHTLNVNIDDLNENFSDVTMRILRFLEGIVPSKRIHELHRDLGFYDLQTSPVYRWSMSNPIINHITGTVGGTPAPSPSTPSSTGGSLIGAALGVSNSSSAALPTVATASSTYLMAGLREHPRVTALYRPVLEMMKVVLHEQK